MYNAVEPAITTAAILETAKRIHLVGIGGVSMCALADVLHNKGYLVTGSDTQESEAVLRLRANGIPVHIGHNTGCVTGQEAVIRTAAVKDQDPEIQAAREIGLPIIERAQAWGYLMRQYRQVLCIAGTHGKTTTTGMSAQIAMAAGADPSVMIGGNLPAMGGSHRTGGDDLMVFEACEYCNSFLSFLPTVAVVLNVEADHLDFFSGIKDILTSFAAFVSLVPEGGVIVVNGDDPNAVACLDMAKVENRRVMRFGRDATSDVTCKNLIMEHGLPSFDIWVQDTLYTHVSLQVPGNHNIMNALAAAAAAYVLGQSGEAVSAGLSAFTGTGRRFQHLGTYHGAVLVDDYAHHPTEVAATLTAVRSMGYHRVLCAFQPHTYSRTAALFDDFVQALTLADKVYMAEIYAAREQPTGLSAATLAQAIPEAQFYGDLAQLADALAVDAGEGDIIITMGAGNINTVGLDLCAREAL